MCTGMLGIISQAFSLTRLLFGMCPSFLKLELCFNSSNFALLCLPNHQLLAVIGIVYPGHFGVCLFFSCYPLTSPIIVQLLQYIILRVHYLTIAIYHFSQKGVSLLVTDLILLEVPSMHVFCDINHGIITRNVALMTFKLAEMFLNISFYLFCEWSPLLCKRRWKGSIMPIAGLMGLVSSHILWWPRYSKQSQTPVHICLFHAQSVIQTSTLHIARLLHKL